MLFGTINTQETITQYDENQREFHFIMCIEKKSLVETPATFSITLAKHDSMHRTTKIKWHYYTGHNQSLRHI